MAKYDDMSFGKAFAAARREKGAGGVFTWKGKRYTTDRADDKPAQTDIVSRADAAIRRAESATATDRAPTRSVRPRPRPGSGRDPNAPTATSVETPRVTVSDLPPARRAAAPAEDRPARMASAQPAEGMTFARWENMTRAERREAGLPTSRPAARAYFNARNTAARGARTGMAKGGMVKKGYAKGGMVKANCGASMKPTQKGTKR